jgi:hypothetical protein
MDTSCTLQVVMSVACCLLSVACYQLHTCYVSWMLAHLSCCILFDAHCTHRHAAAIDLFWRCASVSARLLLDTFTCTKTVWQRLRPWGRGRARGGGGGGGASKRETERNSAAMRHVALHLPAGQGRLPQLCTRTCAPVPATLTCQNPRESAHADSHTHAARSNRVLLFELYTAQSVCVTRCNFCEQSVPDGVMFQLASSRESSTLNSVFQYGAP